jgi:hypothetical protein
MHPGSSKNGGLAVLKEALKSIMQSEQVIP